MRWNTFGEITTITTDCKGGNTKFWSGGPISERIKMARFASRGRNIAIIQCCAPTNLTGVEDKEEVYGTVSIWRDQWQWLHVD